MKKLGGLLLLVLALVLAGCKNGDDAPKEFVFPPTIALHGEVILSGATNVRGGLSECIGAGAYADLYPGAPALINTVNGRPLAVGKITYGVGTNFYLNQLDQCTFRVDLPSVARKHDYQIVVGRQDPVSMAYLDLFRMRGFFSFNFPRPPTPPTTTTTTTPA